MADYNDRIIWPGWETVRLIGRGSFGAVYEIERDMLGEKEKAALKVITIPQSSNDIDELYGEGYDDESITSTFNAYLKSIVAEYSLMRKMNGSANVVNCDDVRYVQHDDGFGWDIFIKMELLTPLTKSLGKTVSDEQVARIGSDICKALILCKKHNIIHRDIKPANIFVSENGDYKLGDFGIAKTVEKTSGGTKIGTYEYMAPEVYHDQPYGSTVDIYSLGMVLYWLLNERRTPFLKMPPSLPTNSEKEQARKRRFGGETIPVPLHGSDELKRIVLKACAYDPKDRYQSAEELLSDFDALVGKVRSHIPDSSALETGNSIPAIGTAAEGDESGKVETQESIDTSEEATVSALHQEAHVEIEEKTVSPFAGNKPQVEVQNTESKRKKSILPVLAAIAAVLAIAVVFFLHRPEQNASPETESSIVTDDPSHLSEAQLREIPDWYYDDSVTIKGNQICFSSQYDDIISKKVLNVCTYDDQGQLYDMRDFMFFPTVEAAEMYYNIVINFDGGTNFHGFTQEEVSYFCMNNTLVQVFSNHYYSGKQYATFDGAVDGWTDLGWTFIDINTADKPLTAEQITSQIVSISAGESHTVGVRSDGSVVACGRNEEGQCDVTDWAEIVAVATGYRHTVGVKSDGTAVACGFNDAGQCNVSTWKDIVSVSAGDMHTVGLKRDGTAIATGYNYGGECDVGSWNNLVAVSAGLFHTVGLRSDGTVVATGRNYEGQCEVSNWRNICAIAAGIWSTVGLKTDGTIVVVGDYGQYGSNITEWRDVIKISVFGLNTIAIAGNGSVYAEGFSFSDTGECNVNDWHDLVAVASGSGHVVGLLGDGTVIATGRNDFGQCDVSQWK